MAEQMTDEQLKQFGFHDKAHWIAQVQVQFPGKKFSKGKIVKGPEFPGCINTGHRATIRRSHVDSAFIVGIEIDVGDVSSKRCFSAPGKREFGSGLKIRVWEINERRKVYVYKSRQIAVETFAAMCETDSRIHAIERATIHEAQEKLKRNPLDVGAMLDLADHL